MALIKSCLCGSTSFKKETINGLVMNRCNACGILHQDVDMTPDQYKNFYEQQYHEEHQESIGCQPYSYRYDHDRKIAEIRLKKYAEVFAFDAHSSFCDVGTGNGAFVDALHDRGLINSVGVDYNADLSEDRTYFGEFEQQNFPSQYFDIITCHDSLEHMVDLISFLRQAWRTLKTDGILVVDFPAFFMEEGRHHWRPIQHLWMLTQAQTVKTLEWHGFEVFLVDVPIPSKFVVYAKKKKSNVTLPRILVLPGMGDIYWAMLKMQPFIEGTANLMADVHIWDFDGRPRSLDFLRLFPFVNESRYFSHSIVQPQFNMTYMKAGHPVIPDVLGYDYLISLNGDLRQGLTVEQSMAEYQANWDVPIFESIEQRMTSANWRHKYGSYIVAYFSELGMHKKWMDQVGLDAVCQTLEKIYKKTNCKIILTGCDWDYPTAAKIMNRVKSRSYNIDIYNECSNTNVHEILGAIKGAKAVIGWAGGNTIFAASIGIPTLIYWSNYFKNERFFTNCVRPEHLGKSYQIAKTDSATPESTSQNLVKTMKWKK